MHRSSDEDLATFLLECEGEQLQLVIHALHSMISYDSHKYFRAVLNGTAAVSTRGTESRQEQVNNILSQLRYFGSNSLAYGLRKASPWHEHPGVAYTEILSDTHHTVAKQFAPKSSIARIDTVANREKDIAAILMNRAIEDIPDKDLTEMLEETGLQGDAIKQTLVELRSPALGAGAVFATGAVLGKKFVRDFMLSALTAYLSKVAQKEGAKQLAIQLAKKLPQKAFLRISNYLGWALLAWDAYKLTGPAKRVTVPTIATIAILRTADRLRPESPE